MNLFDTIMVTALFIALGFMVDYNHKEIMVEVQKCNVGRVVK